MEFLNIYMGFSITTQGKQLTKKKYNYILNYFKIENSRFYICILELHCNILDASFVHCALCEKVGRTVCVFFALFLINIIQDEVGF
jgi:hypothetical protein